MRAGLALLLAWAPAASAHVVVARGSLRQYLQHSALCVHARFETGPSSWTDPSGDRQEFYRVRVLERLSGAVDAPPVLDFFPHAEGLPGFRAGDRAVVCLERTETRPELARHARRFPFFSLQEAGEEWRTDGDSRATLDLARAWARWLAAGGDDVAGMLGLLERGLASAVPVLQRDALLELSRGRDLPELLDREAHVVRLAAYVASPDLSIGRRAALFMLLAGRPGFGAQEQLAGLVASPRDDAERIALARILAASPMPGVQAWLAGLALDPAPAVRRAAVAAQGRRGAGADMDLLRRALADPDAGVARAATRALGALARPEAVEALRRLARGPDAERARWATAELRRLDPASR